MHDTVKQLLIPVTGMFAIALILVLVMWGGGFDKKVVNKDGQYNSVSKDLGGYAVINPTDCDNSYFPVCGHDGKTYDSACKAVAARTKVAHRGGCQE